MELLVKKCQTPQWFVSTVTLLNRSVVVVVDDEGAVAHYWERSLKARYKDIRVPVGYAPKCISLRSPGQLASNEQDALSTGTLFLIDYNLGEGEMNGIELIDALQLTDRAILVTAHSDDVAILDEVIKRGIRLLPKTHMYSFRFTIEIGGTDE